MSGGSGPFYFAWVDSTETTFGAEHHVEDERVFSFAASHEEGQIPTLKIVIRNPGVGLLAPGRKQWAWVSWQTESGDVVPIFFGRLVGIPTDLLGEAVTLDFIARPPDYLAQKQAIAETLKVSPFYDPVFIDTSRRDDADTILEGYSSHWHFGRTAQSVTVSDVLLGEDGDEVFAESDSYYDSVSVSLQQTPLSAVEVRADVHWTQRTPLTPLSFGRESIATYTGASLISEWPKPGSSLGGGWVVLSASAVDVYDIGRTLTYTAHNSWKNTAKEHINGDPLSDDSSVTYPLGSGPMKKFELIRHEQIGIVDAFAIPPKNQPAKVSATLLYVPQWLVATNLVLSYEAARGRSEGVIFVLRSDTQAILSDPDQPTVTDAELISISGADVGLPVLNVLNWLSVAGKAVEVGQIVFVAASGSPLVLTPTYQIAIVAGTAGTTEPAFSEIAGVETIDGGVTWVSLGTSLSIEGGSPDWSGGTQYSAGNIILPARKFYLTWNDLVPPDAAYSGQGGGVSDGQVIKTGGVYQVCTQPGTTDFVPPAFASGRGQTTIDAGVVWTCLGADIPDGTNYQLCTTGGDSGDIEPGFVNAAGTTTTDGDVIWTALGPAEGSIPRPIGDPSRRSYFPTDRGIESLEYLIMLARARLRIRARAVQIKFDCRFERALSLSCRKNATLYDHRLPGGIAAGKVISYTIAADGDAGKLIGSVTIGCSVGNAGSAAEVEGEPSYVENGYVNSPYQFYAGNAALSGDGDVSFGVPIDEAADDGLTFPLTKASATITDTLHGSLGEQEEAIEQGARNQAEALRLQGRLGGLGPDAFLLQSRQITALGQRDVSRSLAHKAIWKELELRPVAGQQFSTEYTITVSPLSVPKTIDLEAAS